MGGRGSSSGSGKNKKSGQLVLSPEAQDLDEFSKSSQIEYHPVDDLKKQLRTNAIVDRLGGPDQTIGSCVSLAYAYAANKNGLDVLDFRGGASASVFAKNGTVKKIMKIPGVVSHSVNEYNDYTAAKKLFADIKPGKEYVLGVGKHAAIVRKASKGYEYLELQDTKKNNGFKKFEKSTLKKRFGCQKSHTTYGFKFKNLGYLIEVDSLKGNDIKHLMGYINTPKSKQKKGAGGSVK